MQSKHIDPAAEKVRVTWVKSAIGFTKDQRATVRALGLRRLGDTVEKDNSAVIRGMIDKVGHLVTVEVVD
jgi:large subunit ribosomal protein L30